MWNLVEPLISMNIQQLNNQFGINDILIFDEKSNNQIVVKINNIHAKAEIMLQGAHLIHWQPINEHPVVWLSNSATFAKSKSIRGGIPICWPWFGAHSTNDDFPAHGYARTLPWKPVTTKQLPDERTQLVFKLVENTETKKLWPYKTDLEIEFIIGSTLEVALITKNMGDEVIDLSEALHTYFSVGDVSKVSISGLEGCNYLDKPDNFKVKKQQGMVIIHNEVDRVYIDTKNDIYIDDPILNRRINIIKNNSDSTVVWNPWETVANKMGDLGDGGYLNMLCVETANTATNSIRLKPGETHGLRIKYSVEALNNK